MTRKGHFVNQSFTEMTFPYLFCYEFLPAKQLRSTWYCLKLMSFIVFSYLRWRLRQYLTRYAQFAVAGVSLPAGFCKRLTGYLPFFMQGSPGSIICLFSEKAWPGKGLKNRGDHVEESSLSVAGATAIFSEVSRLARDSQWIKALTSTENKQMMRVFFPC